MAEPLRLLTKAEVLSRVRVTFPIIWRLMREGRFPRPVVQGDGGKAVWFEHEIQEYLANLPRKSYLGDPGHERGDPQRAEAGRAAHRHAAAKRRRRRAKP